MDDDFGLAALPGLAGDSRLIDGPLQQSLQASVNRLLRAEMDNAMAALREHQSSLQALAEALLRDNTLYRKELAALLPVAPNENPHAKAESTKGSVRKP
jgi:ATP-dependent Zn protease